MLYEETKSMQTKSPLVREEFERPDRYLTRRRYDIRLRTTVVEEFLKDKAFQDVLDIGCGDGSISLALLAPDKHITLLDFSSTMLSAARACVPHLLKDHVEVRQEDFMKASFEPESYDVIICVGLLAHVDSPDEFVKKVRSLLRPQGFVILEFTDAFHFMGRFGRALGRLRHYAAPPRYQVNLLCFDVVRSFLGKNGLSILSMYRYAMPPIPGIQVLGHEALYSLLRGAYGRPGRNRFAWLGNEYICMLTVAAKRGQGDQSV